MGIFKKIFIFVLLLCALTAGASYIIYTNFYEHVVAAARTPKGRKLRLKAEEYGLRKRSKEEKWIDRYDYGKELVQKKKKF